MTIITCGSCAGRETWRVRPDGWFECPNGHELAPSDIDLDSGLVWAVDTRGVLGYVVKPSKSLELIAEASEELHDSGGCADAEYAARTAMRKAYDACCDFVSAYHAGVA
ncbi:hypothetical protein [Streptomyces sp. NPDC046909]|uniref:hypothetical protein n=1 Tax=Streptomyces sp. NPDC046909 TaxID=3155617 RepID=UPI0033CA8D47